MAAGTAGLAEWMFSQKKDESGMSNREDININEFFTVKIINGNLLHIQVPVDTEMTLFNVSGQRLTVQRLPAGLNKLNVNIPAGFYFLSMSFNGQVYCKNIFKCN